MFRPLSVFVGLRYSRAKHKNSFVSFISIASILGISLGVTVLIIGLSAMNGFENALRDQLLSVIPHGELKTVDGGYKDLQKSLQTVESTPGVTGATAFITFNGLLQKDNQMKALQFRAITPATESKVTRIERFIKEGDWSLLKPGQRSLILGKAVADKLQIKVGDSVTLLMHQIGQGSKIKAPLTYQFTLVGLFEMGGQLDSALAFTHIEDAKQILSLNEANTIGFSVDDVLQAQQITRNAGYKLNDYLYINSWVNSQGYLYRDIQMVKSLMIIILLLVVAVACFNIVSTLVMAVNEKRGDIAILKTMGASKWMLRFIFIVQGAFNGFVGCIVGAVFGVYIAENLTAIISKLEVLIGHKLLSGNIYFINYLPSQVNANEVVIITATAFLMSVFATVYPAWRASNIQPALELGYSH
ncbi:lipoprotein-releasing ABC transporter permease subunit LolE [Psychromonas sp. PT13]|uniref:lipoprotein-releasing ABC transporter permease subunit LolE n=1 Tax=Psychromonas sp. PT13 TaxID=3439547 RepID=UPI003EB92889